MTTSLVVQWLRLCTSNAGVLGSIPDWGPRSGMLQLKSSHATMKTKILYAPTKTQHSQINK